MFESIIIATIFTVIGLRIITSVIDFSLATVFDIKHFRIMKEQKVHPTALNFRKRPPVSIVVYARNNEDSIINCVDSIASGTYRNYHVIVIDNSSKDNTVRLVKEYVKSNPKKSIIIVKKRKIKPKAEAISSTVASLKTSLAVVVDATDSLGKNYLKYAVSALSENIKIIVPAIKVDHQNELRGLLRQIDAAVSVRSKKSGNFLPSDYSGISGVLMPTKDLQNIFKKLKKYPTSLIQALDLCKIDNRSVFYESRARLSTAPYNVTLSSPHLFNDLNRPLVVISSTLRLLEPFVALSVFYIAINFDNHSYLLLSWATYISLSVLSIFSCEVMSIRAKALLTLFSPVAYVLSNLESLIIFVISFAKYILVFLVDFTLLLKRSVRSMRFVTER